MNRLTNTAVACVVLIVAGCRTTERADVAPTGPPPITPPPARVVAVPPRLDLTTAKHLALEHNPGIAALADRARAAAAAIGQARAAYYPTIAVDAAASHRHHVPSSPGLPPIPAYEIYAAGASAAWVLFDGFLRRYNLHAARYAADAAKADRRELERLVLNGVATTFYTALLAATEEHIADADRAFNQRFLEDTRKRRELGAASRADMLNFQIRVDGARIDALAAARNRRTALIALAQLIGCDPQALLQAHTALVPPPDDRTEALPPVTELLRTAWAQRPDLAARQARLAAAQAAVHARKAAFAPVVSVSGDSGVASQDDIRIRADDRRAGYGITANWELFDGGRRRQAWRQAKAEAAAAKKDVDALWLEIQRDIRRQYVLFDNARQTVDIQRRIAANTRRIRDDVEEEYKVGRVSLTRLNEVQRDVTVADARLALTQTRILLIIEDLAAAGAINRPPNAAP